MHALKNVDERHVWGVPMSLAELMLSQIRVNIITDARTFAPEETFQHVPPRLYGLRVSPGLWIHKIKLVIHSVMLIIATHTNVSTPTITKYDRAWLNTPYEHFCQGWCIPMHNTLNKYFPVFVDPAEHPAPHLEQATTVRFPRVQMALIDLYDRIKTTNFLTALKFKGTDTTKPCLERCHSFWADLELVFYLFCWHLVAPKIYKFQRGVQR